MPADNGIVLAQLGACDRVSPASIDPVNVRIEVSAQINIAALPVLDDPDGSGIKGYRWTRDGVYFATTSIPQLHDADADTNRSHEYTIQALDHHGNPSVSLAVDTRTSGGSSALQILNRQVPQSANKDITTRQSTVFPMDTPDTGFFYAPSDVYSDSGVSFSWSWYFVPSVPAGVYIVPTIPSDMAAYEDWSQYNLNKSMDSHAGSVAPINNRIQDAKWLIPAKRQLQSFNRNVTSYCKVDIDHLDVSDDKIRSLAGDDRSKGGTTFVDYRALTPALKTLFNQNADLTAVQNPHLIVFNLANFWQGSYSHVVGSVLHELIHIAHYSMSDNDIQGRLGLTKDANDTTNISIKLANDCFPNITPPSN